MHELTDTGLILSVRKYAEHDAIVDLLTPQYGRCVGLVKGAFGKRKSGIFQTGNLVLFSHKSRLEEHLGLISAELVTPYFAFYLSDFRRLTVLSCVCALSLFLPERECVPTFFQTTLEQIDSLKDDFFWHKYARWEVVLLETLGFGLDLRVCAVTGQVSDLVYVSPKSGRAVCQKAGAPWHDKLLALPDFLNNKDKNNPTESEIKKAMLLTGFFLENYIAKNVNCRIPAVRDRLIDLVTD